MKKFMAIGLILSLSVFAVGMQSQARPQAIMQSDDYTILQQDTIPHKDSTRKKKKNPNSKRKTDSTNQKY